MQTSSGYEKREFTRGGNKAMRTRIDKIEKIVKERMGKFQSEILKKNFDLMMDQLKKKALDGSIEFKQGAMIILGADKINSKGIGSYYKYVKASKNISGNAKWVLTTYLDEYAWYGKNYAFPTEKEVAKKCGISERTVRNCNKELRGENKGKEIFMDVVNMGLNQGNLYIFPFRDFVDEPKAKESNG